MVFAVIRLVLYAVIGVAAVVELYWGCKFVEYVYCVFIRRQPPTVSSVCVQRTAVVEQLRKYYPRARMICEMGSGMGGLMRHIARRCDVRVVGIENMPMAVCLSRIGNLFCKNCQTRWMDIFEYFDNENPKFDIAVAYLGPWMTPMLEKYQTNFDVLLSLDFEIPNRRAVRVVDLPGYVLYGGRKYPHRLYVYEFR